MCRATVAADATCQVDIATTNYRLPGFARDEVIGQLPPSSRLFVFPTSRGLDAGWSFPMVRWLAKAARTYDVLHIHALFGVTSSVCAHVAMWRRVPYVIRPLGTLSPYTFANRRQRLKRLYFSLLDRRTVERSAAVHFTAPQEEIKASRLRLEMNPVVIPIPFAWGGAKSLHSRRDNQILFLSRLHPVKGLDLLLPAFATVRRSLPDARLVIAGAGPARFEAHLRAEVERLRIGDAVEFLGFVQGDLKQRLLSEAALFVLPSYQENFGVAVVEALASGTPVIITNEVDLWKDVALYNSGLVVKPDETQLADAMLTVLRDRARAAVMAANGKRQVMDLYSEPVVGRQLADMYRRIAGRL